MARQHDQIRAVRAEMSQFSLTPRGDVLFDGRLASSAEIVFLKRAIARFEDLLRQLYLDDEDDAKVEFGGASLQ